MLETTTCTEVCRLFLHFDFLHLTMILRMKQMWTYFLKYHYPWGKLITALNVIVVFRINEFCTWCWTEADYIWHSIAKCTAIYIYKAVIITDHIKFNFRHNINFDITSECYPPVLEETCLVLLLVTRFNSYMKDYALIQ